MMRLTKTHFEIIQEIINLQPPVTDCPYKIESYVDDSDGEWCEYWTIEKSSMGMVYNALGMLDYWPQLEGLDFSFISNCIELYIRLLEKRDSLNFLSANKFAALSRFDNHRYLWKQNIVDMDFDTRALKRTISQEFPKFGYVYVVHVGTDRFKIGMTENWPRRKKQLGATVDPSDLENAHVFPCADCHQAEAALHRWYSVQCCNGREVFLLNAAQEQALRAIEYCDGIDEMLDTLPLPTEELRAQAKELRNK